MRAPASNSISALTSPVKAPWTSVWQSWPPTNTDEPARAWARRSTRVAGGQRATRAEAGLSSRAAAT